MQNIEKTIDTLTLVHNSQQTLDEIESSIKILKTFRNRIKEGIDGVISNDNPDKIDELSAKLREAVHHRSMTTLDGCLYSVRFKDGICKTTVTTDFHKHQTS